MDLNSVKTNDDVRRLLEQETELTHVHGAVVDNTGQLRGKTYSVPKFLKGLEDGMPITPLTCCSDYGDVLFPIEGLLGGDPSFPDTPTFVVPETVRRIPWESPRRNLQFLMEYSGEEAEYACPRSQLRKQLTRAESMGLEYTASFELEFRLFMESLDEAHDKGLRNLTPYPKHKQYMGVQRHQGDNEFLNGLLDALFDMQLDIEAYHTELDVGFHELVMHYQKGTRAADNCAYIRTFAKAYAQRNNRLASFMPRPLDDQDGNGLHTHMSLRRSDGSPAFWDDSDPNNMSELMRHFIGGMQKMLPELQLLLSPNVNSYRRYAPGLFAPIATSWGINNRTVGLRVVGNDSANGIRIENRLAGADANPYLVSAASLAAGLWGIENEIEPTRASQGFSWAKMDELPDWVMLHVDMGDAIDRFANSDLARDAFGAEFVRVFSDNRRFQLEEFAEWLSESGADPEPITDWELQRFLELA